MKKMRRIKKSEILSVWVVSPPASERRLAEVNTGSREREKEALVIARPVNIFGWTALACTFLFRFFALSCTHCSFWFFVRFLCFFCVCLYSYFVFCACLYSFVFSFALVCPLMFFFAFVLASTFFCTCTCTLFLRFLIPYLFLKILAVFSALFHSLIVCSVDALRCPLVLIAR